MATSPWGNRDWHIPKTPSRPSCPVRSPGVYWYLRTVRFPSGSCLPCRECACRPSKCTFWLVRNRWCKVYATSSQCPPGSCRVWCLGGGSSWSGCIRCVGSTSPQASGQFSSLTSFHRDWTSLPTKVPASPSPWYCTRPQSLSNKRSGFPCRSPMSPAGDINRVCTHKKAAGVWLSQVQVWLQLPYWSSDLFHGKSLRKPPNPAFSLV